MPDDAPSVQPETAFNVLIADDDPVIRRLIVRSLQHAGLRFSKLLEARDGAEALALVSENRIDFILLDLNMPNINGGQFINRIRSSAETEKVPIVVISGAAPSDDDAAVLRRTNGFIQKPFPPAELAQLVVDLLSTDRRPDSA